MLCKKSAQLIWLDAGYSWAEKVKHFTQPCQIRDFNTLNTEPDPPTSLH